MTEYPPSAARDAFEAAMLAGDRDRARAMLCKADIRRAIEWKDNLLSRLTADCLDGHVPFSQLTAAAQVACLLHDDRVPAVVCCGAVAGNTSATGRDFMMMLLRAWGVPATDLGIDVPETAFLDAVTDRGARFVICAVFSRADLASVRGLDQLARACGLRDRFSLLVSGAQTEHGDDTDALSDYPDHRAAAVAEWVARAWRA